MGVIFQPMRLGSPSIFNPQGFHHDPKAAGVFVPGLAQTSIAGVSGLAKAPSPSIASLPTLELGRSETNTSLGVPTPKRLVLSPLSPQAPEVQPTLRDGYTMDDPSLPSSQVAPAISSEPVIPVAPAIADPKTKTTPPEMEQATPKAVPPTPPPPTVPSVPASSGERVPTKPPGDGPLEGTMYTDGTYWRSIDIDF